MEETGKIICKADSIKCTAAMPAEKYLANLNATFLHTAVLSQWAAYPRVPLFLISCVALLFVYSGIYNMPEALSYGATVTANLIIVFILGILAFFAWNNAKLFSRFRTSLYRQKAVTKISAFISPNESCKQSVEFFPDKIVFNSLYDANAQKEPIVIPKDNVVSILWSNTELLVFSVRTPLFQRKSNAPAHEYADVYTRRISVKHSFRLSAEFFDETEWRELPATIHALGYTVTQL